MNQALAHPRTDHEDMQELKDALLRLTPSQRAWMQASLCGGEAQDIADTFGLYTGESDDDWY